MNNFDGSYYAAMQFGELQSRKRKEQEQKELEQKRYEEEKRRSWIQFWVPVSISIVALCISIASLILDIKKLKLIQSRL